MNVATVREGVSAGTPYAGSLELLPTVAQQTLPAMRAPLPELRDLPGANDSGRFDPMRVDLVISNPPYTEINKRLAKLPDEADKVLMRRHFQGIRESLAADDTLTGEVLRGTRTVAPYFVPLAEHMLKRHKGTLAIVHPTTALTSPSKTHVAERLYLAQHFHLDTTVTSHANKNAQGMGINFSESTNINETLMVLRRMSDGVRPATKVVALHRQPESRAEVLELLDAIHTGNGIGKFGRIGEWPAKRIEAGDWSFANWYDQSLADQAIALLQEPSLQPLALHAQIVAPNPNFAKVYENAGENAEQHMFASIGADIVSSMRSTPAHGIRLKQNADQRHRRTVDKPARTFVAFRAAPATTRALAIQSTRPCLSTAFTGILFRTAGLHYAQGIVAFLNSTAGWLQILNQRAFKMVYTRIKPVSVRGLHIPPPDSPHIPALTAIYRKLAKSDLSSLRNPDCAVRRELDRAAAKAVGWRIGRLNDIRRQIAAEPSVSGAWANSAD